MTRILNVLLMVFFFSQTTFAQITMDTERKNDGIMEIYATNTEQVPYTVLINYTELTNILPVGSSGLAVVRPGRSKVSTLKRRVEGQSTNLRYTYTYIKGDYYGKSKQEPVYLIPLPEGTRTTGIRMTHIQNRLQPKEENKEYVGISFKFDLPTEILAPRKGVVSAISMEKYDERENLDFDHSENYIELFHEDGSLTKLMVLRPGSQKVKVGQVVFPGDVLADSAGEDYNSGLHVRLVNMKPVKSGKDKLKYHQGPMKFISKEGESDFSEPHKVEVVFPDEIVMAEMSKKEKKNHLSEN
ncbi:M23 family metallopeptidase [Algoriphagus sp. AGSA1]|uniref:M23 family metallopeptidase n=1 Tax=Algoriphagus sp. AGSA1 TaxID=2907213 RepID=UPI001F165B05|nr:M23 family metallopeptidase [Algoriphagus sp. AGSA1]MCE7056929.1 M23 family metallopeptidase [Algoriphagus sp. AGSA1]